MFSQKIIKNRRGLKIQAKIFKIGVKGVSKCMNKMLGVRYGSKSLKKNEANNEQDAHKAT